MKQVVLLILVSLLSACASMTTVKVEEDRLVEFKGKSLRITIGDKPGFVAMTGEKGLVFGPFARAAALLAGNALVKDYQLQDPADMVGLKLADKLVQRQDMNLNKQIVLSEDSAVSHLSAIFADDDYLLDVRSLSWGISHIFLNYFKYTIKYAVKVRLIDLHQQEVIAEANCIIVPEKNSVTLTYKQLFDDNAARLKTEILMNADRCVKELSKKLL